MDNTISFPKDSKEPKKSQEQVFFGEDYGFGYNDNELYLNGSYIYFA